MKNKLIHKTEWDNRIQVRASDPDVKRALIVMAKQNRDSLSKFCYKILSSYVEAMEKKPEQ